MSVLFCRDIDMLNLQHLLSRFGLSILFVDDKQAIPGSWFGDSEAGLIGNNLYIRQDTPVHSALHESCHFICMDQQRREHLHTNVGGDYDEENAVCYLQILLADFIPEMKQARMLSDMDEWGYTFRLGSSRAWFEQDAGDALAWLLEHQLIDQQQKPLWRIRH